MVSIHRRFNSKTKEGTRFISTKNFLAHFPEASEGPGSTYTLTPTQLSSLPVLFPKIPRTSKSK